MSDSDSFALTDIASSTATAEVVRRYNEVFQQHDPTALRELIAADCIIETPILLRAARAMSAARPASSCGA